MKIEETLFGKNGQKPWSFKKKKDQKSFKEQLEESLNSKKSELQKQAKNHILDILI
ncbi:MAG: hypothetical protein HOF21_12700 [Nitrospina sp.]|jgi:hypothetical protein|nr:hypothetical protein [Nitrospina sp.]MBT4259957.1 hypothetical protein [Nitrospina sp.]MBT5633129.1 hypothetical protein [Nitrospina sp.]